jgi:membrane protease YdiL (CAAX protease family)
MPITRAPDVQRARLTGTQRNVAWAWTRMAIAYALLEWALWTTRPMQQVASVAFLAWIIVTTFTQRRTLRDLGLGVRGFAGASIAIPVSLLAAGLILLAAWLFGTLRPITDPHPLPHALTYTLWAAIQEFILNSYFYLTLEEILPNPRDAAIGAVLLFTLAHIPNPVLLAGTLVASIFFVILFRRYRNIYPLGIAHAILGLTLSLAFPDALLRHMRVGIGYYHFVIK